MRQVRNYYEGSRNKECIRANYSTGKHLGAKYEVMEKYGIHKETFENWVINKLGLTGKEKVLDIGAGNGRFSIPIGKMLKEKGGFLVACDLAEGVMTSSQMETQTHMLPVLHMVADAENLPFLSNEFDMVMANHMLYHLPNLQKGLEEIRRVLKGTGTFLATTNSVKGMPEFFRLHQKTMRELGIPFDVKENDISFSLENGKQILTEYFSHVERWVYDAGFKVTQPEPVLQYYMATQLFQGPFHDQNLSKEVRDLIAPTFLKFTEEMIKSCGGELVISKPVAAFICKVFPI